ncbi:MAG: DUF6273 domain-containing protein [Oscillospiraceae bacterium]|jgi:hypothetical protein|nr:DUF6273 domain-containing protein [Oscillospiraceae bacterium]
MGGEYSAFEVIQGVAGGVECLAVLGAGVSWLAWRHNARSRAALTRTLERTKNDYTRFVKLPLRRILSDENKKKLTYRKLRKIIWNEQDAHQYSVFFLVDSAGKGKTLLMEQLYYYVLRKCRWRERFGQKLSAGMPGVQFHRCSEGLPINQIFSEDGQFLLIEGLDETPEEVDKALGELIEKIQVNHGQNADHSSAKVVVISMRNAVWDKLEAQLKDAKRTPSGGGRALRPFHLCFDDFKRTHEEGKGASPYYLHRIKRYAKAVFYHEIKYHKRQARLFKKEGVESVPPTIGVRKKWKAKKVLFKLIKKNGKLRDRILWCVPFYAAHADVLKTKMTGHAEIMQAIVEKRLKEEFEKALLAKTADGLGKEDLKKFNEQLLEYVGKFAYKMYEDDKENGNPRSPKLREDKGNFSDFYPDEPETQIFKHHTSAFLRRDNGYFQFEHALFREYFVVRAWLLSLKEEQTEKRAEKIKTMLNEAGENMQLQKETTEQLIAPLAKELNIDLTETWLHIIRDAAKSDVVPFGSYRWRVLEKNDKEALLISENCVELRAYNEEFRPTTWEECDLRKYLNGKWLSENFSEADRKCIVEKSVATNPNPWFGTDGGKPTPETDKIFLLSLEELVTYFGDSGTIEEGKNDEAERKWYFSDQYDEARKAQYNGERSWWWLRSPGGTPYRAATVNDGGNVGLSGRYVYDSSSGVRPALRLNLESGI